MEPSTGESLAIQRDRPLAPLTSWRVGGPAAYFAEPSSAAQLRFCLLEAERLRLPVFALGGGSNILVADEGYPGMVIRYAGVEHGLERRGESGVLRAGAGSPLAVHARRTAARGWTGLEWAEGIPGTIGGAVAGNAGAYGGEVGSVLESVTAYSLEAGLEEIPAGHCDLGYRISCFQPTAAVLPVTSRFVLSAVFLLRPDDPIRLIALQREIGRRRRARTPAGLSCGSVFRNPPSVSAGRLIEEAGLKGTEHGPAQISPRHANYIVNRGGARADDILALIRLARERVHRSHGIELQLEVKLVGMEAGSL